MSTLTRQAALQHWLLTQFSEIPQLEPASGDASFRRYWRLQVQGISHIVVDSPPATENNARFIALAAVLRTLGLNTPQVLAADLEQGFLLLTDLGRATYLDVLTADTADALYHTAIDALLRLQQAAVPADLPIYDQALLERELALFEHWLVAEYLQLAMPTALFADTSTLLIDNALAQPRVWVHRDYHSRNLIYSDTENPGVVDFQDAVAGPVTYDLVSLLRDCYIDWPPAQVAHWQAYYVEQAIAAGILEPSASAYFSRWFDLMGMQRHLKAAGIFARLAKRDGKPGYLQDLPRTLGYVQTVAAQYPEFADLGAYLSEQIMPRLVQP